MILFLALLIPAALYAGVIIFLKRGLLNLTPAGKSANNKYTVVIAARNEENNISHCLSSVINQDIGENRYEIIVVDDRSTDSTAETVKQFVNSHGNIQLVKIEQTAPGISPKKHAVQQGVQRAKNEFVVFTDADCVVPDTWLSTIDKYFAKDTGVVQGITCYSEHNEMNTLFYGIQAIDFLSHGVVAAAAIGAGLPINSNANNFAFSKEAFLSCGYGNKCAVVSGDDDLMLQQIWKSKKWKIAFMADAKGAVQTNPTLTIKQAMEQRKRWGSKTVHYCAPQVALLSSVFLFYLVTALLFGISLFDRMYLPAAGAMLGLKCAGEALLLLPGTEIFNKKQLRRYMIVASVIQLPVVLLSVISGVFGRFNWKDQSFSRRVKKGSQA